jgi:hypothetical protein
LFGLILLAPLQRFQHSKTDCFTHFTRFRPLEPATLPEPAQIVQVMREEEILEKRDPALRLPRQAEHYTQIVGHFLAVKNSREIAGAIEAHFQRLQRYHRELLGLVQDIEGDTGEE